MPDIIIYMAGCIGADPIRRGSAIQLNDMTVGLLSGGIVLFVILCVAVVIIKRTLRRRRKRQAIRYGKTCTSNTTVQWKEALNYYTSFDNDTSISLDTFLATVDLFCRSCRYFITHVRVYLCLCVIALTHI